MNSTTSTSTGRSGCVMMAPGFSIPCGIVTVLPRPGVGEGEFDSARVVDEVGRLADLKHHPRFDRVEAGHEFARA